MNEQKIKEIIESNSNQFGYDYGLAPEILSEIASLIVEDMFTTPEQAEQYDCDTCKLYPCTLHEWSSDKAKKLRKGECGDYEQSEPIKAEDTPKELHKLLPKRGTKGWWNNLEGDLKRVGYSITCKQAEPIKAEDVVSDEEMYSIKSKYINGSSHAAMSELRQLCVDRLTNKTPDHE